MDHPGQERLEAFALGRLPESEVASIEEHLLVCEACQRALTAEDRYVAAMRAALREPVSEVTPETRWFGWRGLVWAGGLAMVVVGLLAVPWGWRPVVPVAVTLSSFRGAQAVAMAHAPAGAPLDLGIDSVVATKECRIEIVDAVGKPAWNGVLTATETGLRARVDKGLGEGLYWVRLYAPDAQLLQEFGIRID